MCSGRYKLDYAFNLEIYPRTQSSGIYSYSNKPKDVTNNLTAPISQNDQKKTFNN